MRTIEIKGLTIVLGDGVDVEIEGDVVRIAAKPTAVEHHHHHYPAVSLYPPYTYPASIPVQVPSWSPRYPYITVTSSNDSGTNNSGMIGCSKISPS